jgi:predicted dehydrogenase
MNDKIRWGIIGTGNIAKQFARGLTVLPDAKLVAIGSRTRASAEAFGEMFDVPHRHASYENLAQDSEVDAVYIGTPHPLHRENSLLCLEAGKAVLCEKPFAINAAQTEEIINLARQKQLFLMEAMWTRFLPALVRVRELLASQVLGQARILTADFGFRAQFDPQHRLFNPELGGGALLDVGVYPVSLASMVFGPPTRIASLAHLGPTGVDEQAAVVLGHEDGQMAILSASITISTPQEAILAGSEGQIKIHSPWWKPTKLTLSVSGQEDDLIEMPFTGNGYHYEAAEVMSCLRAGKLESDVMPLDETLSIMQTLDNIRAQWGLRYPMEKSVRPDRLPDRR